MRRSEADTARLIDEQYNNSVEVRCPEILVVRKGATFKCRATSDGGLHGVDGQFVDNRATYTFHPG